jgi:protein-disulfide isomerase
MTDVQQVEQTLQMQSDVQSCLEGKNAVLYGNLTQRATQLQIRVLGGTQNVANYYKDVKNPQNLQEADSRGVQSVPALWVNGQQEPLTGVNNLEQISNFASCE